MMNLRQKRTCYREGARGFTLIEVMISLSVFTLILVVGLGSISAILNMNRRAQALKLVLNNLNFGVEKMSRDMRAGSTYHCGYTGVPATDNLPLDCNGFVLGNAQGASSIVFRGKNGQRVVYRLQGTSLQVSSNGGATFQPFTSSLVRLDYVRFYVTGSQTLNNTQQPRVTIVLAGTAGGAGAETPFHIQTMVTQRLLDVP